MTSSIERGLWVPDAGQRSNVATFVERARRLDEAAVIRLSQRSGEMVVGWAATGFDVLTSRVFAGAVRPADISAGADELLRGLAAAGPSGYVDPGFPMDSAWRGALPPDDGYVHIDDVPADVVTDLAQRGAEVSKEQGAQGPPVSLLDQDVIHASAGDVTVGVPMRCVFALTAMGFVDSAAADDVVRVRTMGAWVRVDARYGSVYYRRDVLRLV